MKKVQSFDEWTGGLTEEELIAVVARVKKALQNVSSYKHYSRRKLDNDGVRAVLLQQSVLFKIARQV